jgi:hypothetical protein
MTYDNNAKKVIFSEPFTTVPADLEQQERTAKAILQTIYKDAGTR